MSTIQMKRQGGGTSNTSSTAKVPSTLAYGEIAVDCFGNMYCGDGKQQVKSQVKNAGNVLFTYKGTLNKDSWYSSGGMYVYTINVASIDGGPDINPDFILSPPMGQQTENFATNQAIQEALGFVNAGRCVPGTKQITCKAFQKPTINFDIYWYARSYDGNYSTNVSIVYSGSGSAQPAVYYAIYRADGWTASNVNGYNYTQKVSVQKISAASPNITTSSVFLTPGFFLPTGVANTDAILSSAMGIINSGYSESGNNSVTTRVTAKPTCDITVRWVVQGV